MDVASASASVKSIETYNDDDCKISEHPSIDDLEMGALEIGNTNSELENSIQGCGQVLPSNIENGNRVARVLQASADDPLLSSRRARIVQRPIHDVSAREHESVPIRVERMRHIPRNRIFRSVTGVDDVPISRLRWRIVSEITQHPNISNMS
ncbi:hypothetical protein OROMI_002189 [Orobanche minor]